MIRKTWCVLSVGVVKKVLARGFNSCEKAVATEHGYFMRGPGDAEWKMQNGKHVDGIICVR